MTTGGPTFGEPRRYAYSIALVCRVCQKRVATVQRFEGEHGGRMVDVLTSHEHPWAVDEERLRAAMKSMEARPYDAGKRFGGRSSRVATAVAPGSDC